MEQIEVLAYLEHWENDADVNPAIPVYQYIPRGYTVHVGKNGDNEVDFVAQKQGVLSYFQVTADMSNEETFKREIRPLQAIRDNYDKIILTLDYLTPGNYEGIKVIHALDWLNPPTSSSISALLGSRTDSTYTTSQAIF